MVISRKFDKMISIKGGIVLICQIMFVIVVNSDKELRLLSLIPISGKTFPAGSACLVPLKMAIERINANPNLLNGYTLKNDYIDTEVLCLYIF